MCGETCTRSGIGCRRGRISATGACGGDTETAWRRHQDSWGADVGRPGRANGGRTGIGRKGRTDLPSGFLRVPPGAECVGCGRCLPDALLEDDWVVDLDIRKFFDTMPWDLVVKAVEANTDLPWVVLYVKRWLAAPLQLPNGSLRQRERGTPQGSAISPVLANLFLHYAFDAWMAREFPGVGFERFADDGGSALRQ